MESKTKQLGITLVEMMVSLLVGAVILAGVMFTYVGMKTTTNDTMAIGELQETGRLALDII
ncbi:prepilin-type N-terminal cleavage/methylation domain-containing protein, partial [Pseudoalteromonas sp. S407]